MIFLYQSDEDKSIAFAPMSRRQGVVLESVRLFYSAASSTTLLEGFSPSGGGGALAEQDAAGGFWYITSMKLTVSWTAARPFRNSACLAGLIVIAACGQATDAPPTAAPVAAKDRRICGFDQPFQYSFPAWQDKVTASTSSSIMH